MWQDIVISIVGFSFGLMLLPQLKDILLEKKILNLWTCGLTSIGLYVLAITFFTLDLWISVISEIFVGTIWLLLGIFSYFNVKK